MKRTWRSIREERINRDTGNMVCFTFSVILGIIGILTSFCFGFGIIPGIVALILGIKAKTSDCYYGYADPVWGIILGLMAINLTVFLFWAFIIVFTILRFVDTHFMQVKDIFSFCV